MPRRLSLNFFVHPDELCTSLGIREQSYIAGKKEHMKGKLKINTLTLLRELLSLCQRKSKEIVVDSLIQAGF